MGLTGGHSLGLQLEVKCLVWGESAPAGLISSSVLSGAHVWVGVEIE